MSGDAAGDEFERGPAREARLIRSVGVGGEAAVIGGGQAVDGVERQGGLAGNPVERGQVALQHGGGGLLAEEIGTVFQHDLLLPGEDEDHQAEVELHRAAVGEQGNALEPAGPGFGEREFLVVEHHLGERRAVAGALRADGFDDPFERRLLRGLHVEGGLADPL